jgi:hypothetical protein
MNQKIIISLFNFGYLLGIVTFMPFQTISTILPSASITSSDINYQHSWTKSSFVRHYLTEETSACLSWFAWQSVFSIQTCITFFF